MNWTKTDTPRSRKHKAEIELKKIKKIRKEKTLRMVKVCDHPLTYKEIEVED